MQPVNYLGIYLAKDHAAVVCLKIQDNIKTVAACFNVAMQAKEETPPDGSQENQAAEENKAQPQNAQPQIDFDSMARQIYHGCAERQFKFDEAALAIDCALFMQHNVHSEFSDVKKISQTVRFDTEEVLGTDATNVAIAFKVDSIEPAGAQLSVFTTPKESFTEILSALQSNNIDPANIEPDVNCLARFISQNVTLTADGRPLFAFLSGKNGYFVSPLSLPWQKVPAMPSAMRTFLLSGTQNRNQVLARQISMTHALLSSTSPVEQIGLCDAAGSINSDEIGKKVFLQTETLDIAALTGVSAENLAECPDITEFAIAYGAALSSQDPPHYANWRSDFMPFQGKKLKLQNSLKYLSIAVTILMLTLGIFGFTHAMQYKKYRSQLHEKYAKEYASVMFGQSMPQQAREANRKIRVSLQRTKEAQKGAMSLSGDEAVAGKWALVLQAFNKCASGTNLHIDTITITDKTISISGDTSSRDNTLKVFDAFRKTNLNVLSQSLSSQQGRDTFMITVEAKKQ